MSEFWTIPPKWTRVAWNALLDHGLENPASYIIRKSGTLIQAINGSTGKIDYSGTDASTVIQAAIDALTDGGNIVIRNGDYSLGSTVTISNHCVVLDGESRSSGGATRGVKLTRTGNFAFFSVEASFVELENLYLYGNGQTANFINLADTPPYESHFKFEGLTLENGGGYGFNLYGCCNIWIKRIRAIGLGNYVIYSNVHNDQLFIEDVYVTGTNGLVRLREPTASKMEGTEFAYASGETLNQAVLNIIDAFDFRIVNPHFEGDPTLGMNNQITIWQSGGNIIYEGGTFYQCGRITDDPKTIIHLDTVQKATLMGMKFQSTKSLYDLTHAGMGDVELGKILWDKGPYKRWENSGTATFSGTGAQTSFVIAHGLASTPKMAVVTAGSSDAKGDFYVTYDATNITVTYATAPPAGTNNVVLRWYTEV